MGCLSFPLLSQEVISVSGDYFENTNGSLSVTIGESITETFTTSSNILTQGFQQSRFTVVSVFEFKDSGITINVAPNPTSEYIRLYIDHYQDLSFQLCDLYGKIINENLLLSDETEISFSGLSSAVYVLNILRAGQQIKTYQIVKK
jgi:hypothetical protein